jgi:FkbM family methyltransferase
MLMSAVSRVVQWSGTAHFRGKGRMIKYWLANRPRHARGLRTLPGGARVECDFAFDYDCMVYLRQEEESDLRILGRILREGDTFVDCGANIGIWSLVAASTLRGSGKVVAFEPNPYTVARLRKNVYELNGFRDCVEVVAAAVGRRAGTGALIPGVSHNISRITGVADATTISVPVTTIDTAVAPERVAGIKLDVEGSELDALASASSLLATRRPWLCVEFNTILAGADTLAEWPVDRMLRDYGYTPSLFGQALSRDDVRLPASWRTKGYVNLLYRVRDGNAPRGIT